MTAQSPLAEAAEKIRAAIREAGAEQGLPPYPPQATIRVSCYSSGLRQKISIDVENVPRDWLREDFAPNLTSQAGLLLGSVLLEIAERHFTANGTTSFIGVHFHAAEEG